MSLNYLRLTALSGFVSASILSFPAFALELPAGKYKHSFADGTCGIYTVNSKSKFTKYEYGPCGGKPTFVTKRVRLNSGKLIAGATTIKDIKTDERCFWGTWQWDRYTIPNKRFCKF